MLTTLNIKHQACVLMLLQGINVFLWDFFIAHKVKNLPVMQETQVQSLGQEDPLEKGMATHSSILAWRIMDRRIWWAIQSMGSQRVGHNCMTNTTTKCVFKKI